MRPSHILLRSTTPCPNKDSPALKSTRPAVPIQKKLSPAPFNSMASPMTDNPAPTKSKPPMEKSNHLVFTFIPKEGIGKGPG